MDEENINEFDEERKIYKRQPKQKVIKDRAYFAMIGRKGGNRTKQVMLEKDPEYYSNIGWKGGREMAKRGKEYYSRISKMATKENRQRARQPRPEQEWEGTIE